MNNDMTYTEWMRAVNRVIRDITGGFSADDLVDAPTRQMYDDEYSPLEAAQEIIEQDGTFSELL